jgi:hypothetical protein
MVFRNRFLGAVWGGLLLAGVASLGHAQEVSVDGTWTCNSGKVSLAPPVTPGNWTITIRQAGSLLLLTDESGKPSSGRLSEGHTVSAPDWKHGNTGHLGLRVEGVFYRASEAVQKLQRPETTAWNAIRWDRDVLCIKG